MAIRKMLRNLRTSVLYAKTPPSRTALSLAIGVGIALGPLPGLHLLVTFALLKFFRLNSIVLLGGVFVHNPWTMIPIHALGLTIGDLLLYGKFASIEGFRSFPWEQFGFFSLFKPIFWQQNRELFLSMLAPFALGSTVMAVVGGVLTYKLALNYLKRNLPDNDHDLLPAP